MLASQAQLKLSEFSSSMFEPIQQGIQVNCLSAIVEGVMPDQQH